MSEAFKGQRVVVLGGSSGIGFEVAKQAAGQGAAVVIVSSNAERVRAAAEAIGGAAKGVSVNLRDEAAIAGFFAAEEEFDHLVYTAADPLQLHLLAETDLKQARDILELRYWSAVAAVKYGAPKVRKGGSITLTTGVAGERPSKTWVIISSICEMMKGLTRALAVELAPLRVNCVSPGVVRTNIWANMSEAERASLYEGFGGSLLVGRAGEADEVARTYLYLMQQGFSTGQIVVVDGGTSLV